MKAQRGKLENEKAIELSNNIADYSHHLSETINDFRDFFKSEKKSEETSYTEIIESVLKIIEESVVNKQVELIKDFHCEDRFVSYPNELKQVVLNLIKNAEDILIEKEIKKPYIKIQTYKMNKQFVLEVSDNGGGIPTSIINNVFDPYFSTKTQKDGTGLGLYMSKTIIEQHCNGELSVSNNESGAVFKVILNQNF
jgi:signal transduction histidine kinase